MLSQIPNIDAAIIDEAKIKDYLLNLNHSDGRGKAIFFASKGFTVNNSQDFRGMLILHASNNPVSKVQQTEWGTKYVVNGPVNWRDENEFNLTTVWIIENGESFPKLATAYPAHKL